MFCGCKLNSDCIARILGYAIAVLMAYTVVGLIYRVLVY